MSIGERKLRCYLCSKLLATIGLPVQPYDEIRGICNECYLKYGCSVGTGFMQLNYKEHQ